jgi:hypothetical protein
VQVSALFVDRAATAGAYFNPSDHSNAASVHLSWHELTTATFSHDDTGKRDRLDRFMGVEDGRFFLSHGGFVPGYTPYDAAFTRPPTGTLPQISLPRPRAFCTHAVRPCRDASVAGIYGTCTHV